MRGLDRLRKIRLDGLKPQGPVKFDTDPASREYGDWIVVDQGDTPASVDLRPFKGLAVIVSALDFKTGDEWAKALAVSADSVAMYVVSEFGVAEGPAFLKFKGEMLA